MSGRFPDLAPGIASVDRRTNPLKAEVNTRFCRSACPLYDDRVEGCPQVGKASGETHKCAWTTGTLKRHHALRGG